MVEKEGVHTMNAKMMVARPIKPKILQPSAEDGVTVKPNKGRSDPKPGDTIYKYALGEGDGNKYTRRKLHIIGETGLHNCLYLCEHRGKYATTKECVLKSDYRFGLGAEKAN
jgi:hypothetical protein